MARKLIIDDLQPGALFRFREGGDIYMRTTDVGDAMGSVNSWSVCLEDGAHEVVGRDTQIAQILKKVGEADYEVVYKVTSDSGDSRAASLNASIDLDTSAAEAKVGALLDKVRALKAELEDVNELLASVGVSVGGES